MQLAPKERSALDTKQRKFTIASMSAVLVLIPLVAGCAPAGTGPNQAPAASSSTATPTKTSPQTAAALPAPPSTAATGATPNEATGVTDAEAPVNGGRPKDQSSFYDVAVGVDPATISRCAALDIGKDVQAAIGKSTLLDSGLMHPDTSPITACVFAVGPATAEGKEDYTTRDTLSVSVNYQGRQVFDSVVKEKGVGENVAIGDEAHWWSTKNDAQISVLRGTTLISVFTLIINNPPVLETKREALENIANKLVAAVK